MAANPMDSPLPKLYHKDGLSKDVIELGDDNPWKLGEKNKVRLVCGEFAQLATVSIAAAGDPNDADHVLSSTWIGNDGIHGSLRRVSSWAFTASLLRASVKLRLGLFCAIIAIATAYINAALAKDGTVQYHLGTIRWLLFALTAASILVAWAKDIWGQ